MTYLKYFSFWMLCLCACQNEREPTAITSSKLKEIPVSDEYAGEPNLFVGESGATYLSWIAHVNDTTAALQFSTLKKGKWTTPKTIASGTDWFVNWADFPSLAAYQDGQSLAAHWLQKSAKGTYDYDVRIAQSKDSGDTWSASFIPHQDGIAAEHGFVTMLPLPGEKMFATWLDGRNTKGDGQNHDAHGHGHGGAMTLRSATFDKAGKLYDAAELDNRICDCCQTDAALTDKGVVVVYRDRSEEEVRDISIVRHLDGEWTQPRLVHEDNWKIAGCPVNGPAIDADQKNVVVAWHTMSNDKPQVQVAFSDDSGATFGIPVRIDEGDPLGRVDIELLRENVAIVTWLETDNKGAAIKAVQVNPQGKMNRSFVVANSKSSRQSGFPIVANNGKQVIFAWTHADSLTSIKTAMIDY